MTTATTATTATQENVLGTWAASAVDVATIEVALGRLWKEAGARDVADGRQPPVRTSVMNLVVYVPHQERAERVKDVIAALAERHPSRTIVIVADPDAPTSSIDAEVSARCVAPGTSANRVCWEQITIEAHGATACHAPGVAIPLLLPDLPTVLWWTDDIPFGTALFDGMRDLCDRLIVDSDLFARPIGGLVKLSALSRATADNPGLDRGVGDFHWMRLTPWRNLTAQFFDNEQHLPYVGRIEGVTIGYAREEGQEATGGMAQALLLAGWLVSQLGWTARPSAARRRGDTLYLEAERPGATVPITIEPREPVGAVHGDLVFLTLTATLRDVPAVFSIKRCAEDSHAATMTKIGGAEGVDHAVRMVTRAPEELLHEELEVFRHDDMYEQALGAAAALCERVATEE